MSEKRRLRSHSASRLHFASVVNVSRFKDVQTFKPDRIRHLIPRRGDFVIKTFSNLICETVNEDSLRPEETFNFSLLMETVLENVTKLRLN